MTIGENEPRRNRRRLRSQLVNYDVRLRLVLDDAVFACFAALAAIGILYYLGNREIGDSLYSAHLSIKETRELLTNGVKVAGLVTFVAVLIFGLWSLVDAHRIAGPMHRLHRLLHEIGGGNLTHEIRFRRRDEFQEIAQAADGLVETFASRIEEAREHSQAIRRVLEVDPLTPAQLADLRAQAKELTDALSVFCLPGEDCSPEEDSRPLT